MAESHVLESIRLAPVPSTVLDIGCEGGRWSKLIFDLGRMFLFCPIQEIISNS